MSTPQNVSGLSSPYAERVEQYGQGWYRCWLGLALALSFVMSLIYLLQTHDHRQHKQPMIIFEGDTIARIKTIQKSSRAIVFLDAKWSRYAVSGRKNFKEAASLLADSLLSEIELFILDEWPLDETLQHEQEVTQKWLHSLNLKVLSVGNGYGIGAGSVIWLEAGRVVHEEWSATTLGPEGIVNRTQTLWGTESR